ncbi:KxYKxGKxW signal peptide domain-containing protein, partial [Staphylococcus microti]|uniref:KxYKxGKxW signal peptide domain-containing protein n=1 Tax=Staphylococcus microti TaxID=569857 RepID=UPI000CD381BE
MTKKFREFKKSLGEEKARVKLYKSGKNWVKAGIKEIQLLRMLGLSLLTDKVDKDQDEAAGVGNVIKRNALKTTAVTGGLFTVNMLHDQQAFAASQTPITSELATQSQTIGDQTSVAIEQSQAAPESESTVANSEGFAVSESTTNSDTTKASESESAKDDASTSTEQNSQSTSESESKSASESVSISESKQASTSESTSASTSESEKASESKEAKASDTKTTSESQKASDSNTQSSNVSKTSNSMTSVETSTSHSTSMSSVIKSDLQKLKNSFFRSVNQSVLRAVSSTPAEQVFTGTGTDKLYNKPIYYKLRVTSDGKRLTFQYTVSYDNPNTTAIEQTNIPTSASITSSHDSLLPMLHLGNGYGTPSSVTGGVTEPGYNGTYKQRPAPSTSAVTSSGNGNYWWDAPVLTGYFAKAGAGLMSQFTVPITNPSGDLSWTFTPYATQDDTSVGRANYFNGTIKGTEPISSASQSQSQKLSETQASASLSTSTSQASASLSTSTSLASVSLSQSTSQSAASASRSTSLSQSTSQSAASASR